MENAVIEIYVNPLSFIEVDEPWTNVLKSKVTTEHILKYLCEPSNTSDIADLVERYKRISVESPRLSAAPAEACLLERLIWPLRHAKGSFMVGNVLGTISLCGMVGEMAAVLAFDLSDVRLNNTALDQGQQKALFGSPFENLGQERRVEILRAYGLIDEPMKQAFDIIRTRRRKYLHLWSADHRSMESDAIDCFKAAVVLVVSVLGLGVKNGRLILRPEVCVYLSKHVVEPEPVETQVD